MGILFDPTLKVQERRKLISTKIVLSNNSIITQSNVKVYISEAKRNYIWPFSESKYK